MEDRLQGEVWRDIPGYDGIYQVSNFGNVRSFKRRQWRSIRRCDNGHGYLFVTLCSGKCKKNHYVHRLVAQQFVENKGFDYVNHKDFDRRNNRADNLEWCTQHDNVMHSSKRMRVPHKPWKESSTKEKYIYIRNGRYRLYIPKLLDRTYYTLDEAIREKELLLNGGKYFAG